MLSEIGLVAAVNAKNRIGKDGRLLYRIKDDLRRFKELTTGHVVLMGRKTFESLPGPLPNRKNVVLTSDDSYAPEGACVFHSIDDAILDALADPSVEKLFVIGGEQVYRCAMPYVDTVYLTEIDDDAEGDASFPGLDPEQWSLRAKSDTMTDEASGLQFRFKTFKHIETIEP